MRLSDFKVGKYSAPSYIVEALSALKPPDDLTVSEWSEKYRLLDSKSSAMPGLWRNQITPYLVGIMDEFNNYETEEITFVKPTQVGGTEAMQNMLAYIVAQDPSPTMVVYPTDDLGEETSENRLQPMFEGSPELAKHYLKNESQKDELQFDNMYISIAGSNSPSGLASKPIKYLFLDEVDKYPSAGQKEADPVSLAKERTKTFRGRKIYECSTPTTRTGHIWKSMESADTIKHYFVPCPHCGKFIELFFVQIKWPGKETGMSHADRAAEAFYCCQECGAVIHDRDKPSMLQKGEWRAVKESTKVARSVAFWLNTLYSPFTTFAEIAKAFMDAKDDPDKLHNFTNSWLAEPWEDTKLKTSADLVMDRQTELEEFIVPSWAKFLTAGADVQENCIYYVIRAFGDFITSQLVTRGQVHSWQALEKVLNLQYEREDGGTPMVTTLAFIDSGDQTDDVYNFCAEHSEWAFPCKGKSDMNDHYKISTVNKSYSKAHGMQLIIVDGGKYKNLIASRMRLENGPKSWMVFKGCGREYAEQVTAEHLVVTRDKRGREKSVWVQKKSHGANHYLDCEVYAMAAADMNNVRSIHLSNIEEESQSPTSEPTSTPEENNWLSSGDWLSVGESWL